jgi:hypothetical protein
MGVLIKALFFTSSLAMNYIDYIQSYVRLHHFYHFLRQRCNHYNVNFCHVFWLNMVEHGQTLYIFAG